MCVLLIIKIDNYNLGKRIVSLAFSKEIEEDLKKNDLGALLLEKDSIYFWKDNVKMSITDEIYTLFSYCDNYDVFQIDEQGNAYLFYNNESDDNAFMLTGKCNSNCIMCPAANSVRKNGRNADMSEMINIIRHIPLDARHFTITGGEPFLVGKQIFPFFQSLKTKFIRTDFLLLTNGRALSITEYAEMFNETAPQNMLIGIPIHGHNQALHDEITQTPGGFVQTIAGIKNLLKYGRRVEIRIVVSLMNYKEIYSIANLIIREFPTVDSVKIMGMEMTGSAAVNRKKLWLSYKDAFEASKEAINELINNKIDVALYNFPLCAVEKPYRMLCRKSITDYKVRFAEECDVCNIKDACGGMFLGTFRMAKEDVVPEVNV